jgi:hypothetical protein
LLNVIEHLLCCLVQLAVLLFIRRVQRLSAENFLEASRGVLKVAFLDIQFPELN